MLNIVPKSGDHTSYSARKISVDDELQTYLGCRFVRKSD